jgi:hypothetical protein
MISNRRRPSSKTVLAAGAIIGVCITASAVLGYHLSGSSKFCMTCHTQDAARLLERVKRANEGLTIRPFFMQIDLTAFQEFLPRNLKVSL